MENVRQKTRKNSTSTPHAIREKKRDSTMMHFAMRVDNLYKGKSEKVFRKNMS